LEKIDSLAGIETISVPTLSGKADPRSAAGVKKNSGYLLGESASLRITSSSLRFFEGSSAVLGRLIVVLVVFVVVDDDRVKVQSWR
jgi:hypothetical protein